jgi:ribosomal protein S18 acetylase RimI-like enzyme
MTHVTAMNTTIRLAEKGDHSVVVALVLAFRDQSHHRALPDADVASSAGRLLVDPMTDFLLALSERGDALGYVQLRYQYSLWVSGFVAQLEDLFVVSSFRRHGIGLRLLNAAVARASERLARFVWLNTNERNLDAVRLYTRAGFSSAREQWQGGRQLWLERAL